jgi:hypothetical protein
MNVDNWEAFIGVGKWEVFIGVGLRRGIGFSTLHLNKMLFRNIPSNRTSI